MDRRAWVRDTLSPKDWLVTLPAEAVEELDAVVHRLRREPFPTLLLSPTQFELSHCREVMAAVGRELRDGIGLAVVDRVPVERYSADENQSLAWLLGSLLGRLVAQKWDGLMIYDVRDTGRALSYGVRRSVTNLDLQFHTDAPWLSAPPELVGLLCVHPAMEGGMSRFVSLVTAHEELEDKPLDDVGHDAIRAMSAVLNAPRCWVEFTIEQGQLQYLNNRLFAHSRTPFRDAEEPERRRHLIRLWNRDEGRQTFHA